MYQQITLIGNLGRDPQFRFTQDGTPVTSLSVATSRRWRAQDGTTQEKTVWFGVSVWERQAEACNQYLTKGQRVLVVGEIEEPRIYTDREGNTRASLDVRARNVEFLTSRAEAQGLTPGSDQPAEGGEGADMPF